MSMSFTFTVTVEVERTQGKFATREELAEQIIAELEGANPGTLEGENGGEYEVSDFSVEETPELKMPRKRRNVTPELLQQIAKVRDECAAETKPEMK